MSMHAEHKLIAKIMHDDNDTNLAKKCCNIVSHELLKLKSDKCINSLKLQVERTRSRINPPKLEIMSINRGEPGDIYPAIGDVASPGITNSLDPIVVDNNFSVVSDSSPKLSKRRWLVLIAMCIMGFSIAVTNDTQPILHLILKVLDFRIDKFLLIGQVFGYMLAVVAVPTAWFVDKYGIKVAVYALSALFVMNGVVKSLLYSPDLAGWSEYKIIYWIMSHIVGTEISAIYYLLPLKIAESWFSEAERSFAGIFMFSQAEVAVSITSYTFPRTIKEVKDIKILAYLNVILVSLSAIACLICVTKSAPKYPPNERVAKASQDTTPFIEAFMKMIRHRDIIIHLVHMSIFECAMLSVSTALQDIFTSVGHSEIFVGDFMSIMAIVSLVLTVILACFVHRVKDPTLTCKLGSLVQTLAFVGYLVSLIIGSSGWVVITASLIFIICKSWVILNFYNMTAQLACGVVPQATIIGFMMTLTILVRTVIQTPFVALIEISNEKSFYGHSLIFLVIVCFLNDAIYLIFFKGGATKESETCSNDEESVQTN